MNFEYIFRSGNTLLQLIMILELINLLIFRAIEVKAGAKKGCQY